MKSRIHNEVEYDVSPFIHKGDESFISPVYQLNLSNLSTGFGTGTSKNQKTRKSKPRYNKTTSVPSSTLPASAVIVAFGRPNYTYAKHGIIFFYIYSVSLKNTVEKCIGLFEMSPEHFLTLLNEKNEIEHTAKLPRPLLFSDISSMVRTYAQTLEYAVQHRQLTNERRKRGTTTIEPAHDLNSFLLTQTPFSYVNISEKKDNKGKGWNVEPGLFEILHYLFAYKVPAQKQLLARSLTLQAFQKIKEESKRLVEAKERMGVKTEESGPSHPSFIQTISKMTDLKDFQALVTTPAFQIFNWGTLEVLEKVLNIRFVVVSKVTVYDEPEDEAIFVISCTDRHLEMEKEDGSTVYVLVSTEDGLHYRLLEQNGKQIFSKKEIPRIIKDRTMYPMGLMGLNQEGNEDEAEDEDDEDEEYNHTDNDEEEDDDSENWIHECLGELDDDPPKYEIIETLNNGDCFFDVISKAYENVSIHHSIAELRNMVARKVTKESYQDVYNLFREMKSSYQELKEKSQLLMKEIETTKTNLSKLSNLKKLMDEQKVTAIEMENIKNAINNSTGDLTEYDTLEKYKSYIRSPSYYANEWAISVLEKELNTKIVILSQDNYEEEKEKESKGLSFEYSKIVECGFSPASGQPFQPSYYIITSLGSLHYRLVGYAGRRIFTFDTIPSKIKDFIYKNCIINKKNGAFLQIREFANMQN